MTLPSNLDPAVPHGLMVHHLHGDSHRPTQGSLSAAQLAAMIDAYGRRRFLSPDEWLWRAARGTLRNSDRCVTFDDGLRCQYDIALPLLRQLGITAFWFVYSSPLDGVLEKVELYRWVRMTYFANVEDFYDRFRSLVLGSPDGERVEQLRQDFRPDEYLPEHRFYTASDREFRWLRDVVLGTSRYDSIMSRLMASLGVDTTGIVDRLWIDAPSLRALADSGHEVGLHSHTHPTVLAGLPEGEQASEYERNRDAIARVTGRTPRSVAHPCDSYDQRTLRVLTQLGITHGFTSRILERWPSRLEAPRQDTANLAAHIGRV